MFQSETLKAAKGIRHGFFTRQGGKSQNIFASLNCGFGSGDDHETVKTNRALAMNQLGAGEGSLVTAYQTHSANACVVTETWAAESAPKVDGMASNVSGIALGILTADCAPVLFADVEASVIGAAHAGWRGAKDGVLTSTLEAMQTLGAQNEKITAVIGPCIHQSSYEVSDSFFKSFLEDDPSNEEFFVPSKKSGHKQFDLPGFITDLLKQHAVGHIESLELDTYINEDIFFSYRRSTHRDEQQYGRLISAIYLTPPQTS